MYSASYFLAILLLATNKGNSLKLLSVVKQSCIARTDEGTVNLTSVAKSDGNSVA